MKRILLLVLFLACANPASKHLDAVEQEPAHPGELLPPCIPEGALGASIPVFDLLAPESETRPFPNLAFARWDKASPTGLRLDFKSHPFSALLNVADGFGATAPFVIPFPFEPDPSTLDNGIFLIRTTDADNPLIDKRRLYADRIRTKVKFNSLAEALIIEPLEPLQEHEHYALVVTRCVRDKQGRLVGRAPAMDMPLPQDSPLLEELARAQRYLARNDVNLPQDAIALVLPTVVRSTASRLRILLKDPNPVDPDPEIEWAMPPTDPDGRLSQQLLERIPAVLELLGPNVEQAQLGLYDFSSVALVAMGRFTARRYLDPQRPAPAEPGQGFEDLRLRFFLTLPYPSEKGPPFPVVLFQHAFGVCKETALALAGSFAKEGLALLAIDAVEHGDRGSGKCPSDPSAFLTIGEPLRLWYNFAESALEAAQAARMAMNLALDIWPWPQGDGVMDLKMGTVGLIGQSMGAFLSAVIAGIEEGIGPVVLNVGGGQIALFFGWGIVSNLGIDPWELSFSDFPPFVLDIMAPIQTAMDDLEPLVFSRDFFAPQGRHLLMQQAIEDEVVPAEVTLRLARNLGLARLAPGFRRVEGLADVSAPARANLPDERTGVIAQFSPAEHAFLLINAHPGQDPLLVLRGQEQAARFFSTFFSGQSPVVIDPYEPRL